MSRSFPANRAVGHTWDSPLCQTPGRSALLVLAWPASGVCLAGRAYLLCLARFARSRWAATAPPCGVTGRESTGGVLQTLPCRLSGLHWVQLAQQRGIPGPFMFLVELVSSVLRHSLRRGRPASSGVCEVRASPMTGERAARGGSDVLCSPKSCGDPFESGCRVSSTACHCAQPSKCAYMRTLS